MQQERECESVLLWLVLSEQLGAIIGLAYWLSTAMRSARRTTAKAAFVVAVTCQVMVSAGDYPFCKRNEV